MKKLRKKQKGAPVETQGDALVAIGKEDVEALKLVGDIMERNAEATARSLNDALQMEQRAHEQTLQELREARHQLLQVRERFEWLLGGPMPYEMRAEFEQIAEEVVDLVHRG